jgi:nucleotide-binding universal stress UspA family protein
MAIKDILVHLDASPRSSVRLGLACALAKLHSAHLAALYIVDVPPTPLLYGNPAGFVDVAMIEELSATFMARARNDAAAIEQSFQGRIRGDDIKGEWRFVEGPSGETVALHARYADLAIVGQAHPGEFLTYGGDIAATTMLSSGRPVLVVPDVGDFATVGETIVVGWKSSREAARAVHDALPLMQSARSVKVLAINPERGIDADGERPAEEMALHLARHCVTAEAAHTIADGVSEGDILLNQAADTGADLIVVGGYGHSRAREFIFGGVTRTLLSTMTVPVFFSH